MATLMFEGSVDRRYVRRPTTGWNTISASTPTTVQQNLPSGTPDELAGMAETTLAALPAAEYPHLREVIVDDVLKSGSDYTKESEFGLDMLLGALEPARDERATGE